MDIALQPASGSAGTSAFRSTVDSFGLRGVVSGSIIYSFGLHGVASGSIIYSFGLFTPSVVLKFYNPNGGGGGEHVLGRALPEASRNQLIKPIAL